MRSLGAPHTFQAAMKAVSRHCCQQVIASRNPFLHTQQRGSRSTSQMNLSLLQRYSDWLNSGKVLRPSITSRTLHYPRLSDNVQAQGFQYWQQHIATLSRPFKPRILKRVRRPLRVCAVFFPRFQSACDLFMQCVVQTAGLLSSMPRAQ